jgi:hypothetical protein
LKLEVYDQSLAFAATAFGKLEGFAGAIERGGELAALTKVGRLVESGCNGRILSSLGEESG